MKYVVTGATGFIGKKLCSVLIGYGHEVVTMQRSESGLASVIENHKIDLLTNTSQFPSMTGVDVVFHLAGIAHKQVSSEDYYQVNCVGTLGIARHAAQQGVKHFVFLSSTKAMGCKIDCKTRSESDLGNTDNDAYGDSKRRAEKALKLLAVGTSMSITTIRTPLVFGGGVKGNMQALLKAILKGMPRPASAGGSSMVSLPDLVDGMLVLGEQWGLDYRCFILCDNESYTTQRIFDAVIVGSGKVPSSLSVPLVLCRIACWLRDMFFLKGGTNGGESTYEKLFEHSLFSSAAIQRKTSWQPVETLESMMPEIIESLSDDIICDSGGNLEL